MTPSYSVRLRAVVLALVALVITSSSLMAQWSGLPALPEPRTWSMQTVLDGKLYVFGGMDAAGYPQTEAWVMDLANTAGGWSPIAEMPEDRGGGYATTIAGKIYIVGGVGIASSVEGRPTVLEYDAAANGYTPKAAMTTPAWFSGFATVGTKIVAAGGLTRLGTSNAGIQLTQVYDVTANTWSAGSAMPSIYYNGHAATIGNDVYYFGGINRQGNSTYLYGGMLKLVGGTGAWQTVAGTWSTPVYSGAAGVLDGKIYVAGGLNTVGEVQLTQQYDPVANEWSASYPLALPTSAVNWMPSSGTDLFLVGGTSGLVQKLSIGEPRAVAAVTPSSVNIAAKVGQSGTKTITIANLGVVELTGSVEVPAAATWLSVSPSSIGISAGGADAFTLTADASSLAVGTYTATVNVTTNDAENPTIAVNVRLFVVENLVAQETKVVIEEATGAWCGPCGTYGGPMMRALGEAFGERLIGIALHDRNGGGTAADPMGTTATESLNRKLGVRAFPTAAIQRQEWGPDGKMVSVPQWEATINSVLEANPFAPAAIQVVSYSYDAATKRVNAKLKITTADAIDFASGATLRVTGVVTEDGLMYTQNGAPENPWRHDHVARSFWPSIDGQTVTIPSGATDAGVLLPGKEIIVNASFAVTGVVDADNSHVVWLLHINNGANLGPILQAAEVELTASITEGGGGGGIITVVPDAAVKSIAVGETATFNTTVTNVTSAPIEVSVDRMSNTLPSGEWSSQLCVGNDPCSPTTANKVQTTVLPNQTVIFRVKVVGGTPSAQGIVGIRVTAGDTTVDQTYTVNTGVSGIGSETGGDAVLALSAYPNPTSAATRVEFTVPGSGLVSLDLFAGSGEKVRTLFSGRSDAGRRSVNVDLAGVPAGVYTVVLTAGDRRAAQAITVVR